MPVPRLQLPPHPAALAALALAFVLPGLAGHEPWKSYDALGIGVAYEMALSGDAIVPHIADLPLLTEPPLYHWLAAACGWLFQLLLEFHAAARIASGAFTLAALWLIHVAARDWSLGEERSRITGAGALLLLLGSIGLMVHAHEAVPQLATLAALCGALAVLPHAARRPVLAGIAFGAALGFAFLSSTWIAPSALFTAVAVAHLACDEWRTRRALPFLAVSFLVTTIVSVSWPFALRLRSPQLFDVWWTYGTLPYATFGSNLRYYLPTIGWFAWPAWPLALWAMWALRRRWRDPRMLVPAAAVALMFLGVVYWGPDRDVNLIPLLAPLAFLASQGIPTLRRGAAAALDWFGVVTFAFLTGLVWLGYVAMMSGAPARVAANFARLAPGFAPQFQLLPLVVAAALTAGWLYVVLFTAPSPLRSVARWAAGIALLWGTFAMLWMPWADYQKGYRGVAHELAARIPPGSGCVAARSLGLPQRAALHYHGGIRTQTYDPLKPRACPLLLVQGNPRQELDAPADTWAKLADLGRPGDRNERIRLYRLMK